MIQPSFGYLGHIHYKKSRVGLKQSFQSDWGQDTSTRSALGYWSLELIIDDLHERGSATFQVKPNQPCFLHQPECRVLGITTYSPLLAVMVGNLYVSRCPSLTVITPKFTLVCNPPYNQPHHTSCSRDSRSLLEPLQGQWTPDIFLILPGFWCSFEYRRI